MRRIRCGSLLLLLLLLHTVLAQEHDGDSNSSSSLVSRALVVPRFGPGILDYTIEELFDFCYDDAECRHLFLQDDHKDPELFEKIFYMVLDEPSVETEYDLALLNLQKQIWLWSLKTWALKLPTECTGNKHFIIDSTTGRGKCVCPVDKSCEDACNVEPILVLSVSLGLVFLALLLAGSFCCKDRYPPFPPQVVSFSYQHHESGGSSRSSNPSNPNSPYHQQSQSASSSSPSTEPSQQTTNAPVAMPVYPTAASVLRRQQTQPRPHRYPSSASSSYHTLRPPGDSILD